MTVLSHLLILKAMHIDVCRREAVLDSGGPGYTEHQCV